MTVVKMCGLTRREDVDAAVAAGATALGFVMWPGSPRAVRPERVATITTGVPSHVMKVGVFVDAPVAAVAQAVTAAGLTAIQLHGREDAREYLALGVQVITAVAPQSDADIRAAIALPGTVIVLVDAHDPVQRGGTGRSANWPMAKQIAAARPILLAGGLTASNVAEAVNAVEPWGIDVSSGIESSPGIKDPARIQQFMTHIRLSAHPPTRPSVGPSFGQRDPDSRGYFGEFGGRFIPETLVAPVESLTAAYVAARTDPAFVAELQRLLSTFVGRPTPLYEASHLTGDSGVRVFLKREDLAHTGAHKINNAVGQVLLARRMGKTRVVAETGAGQHGVATATACALLGLECVVYMGADDMARQALNVFRMRVLGTTVTSVDGGSRTLKDAINEAMRDWVANVSTTAYVLGSVLGPHPYPLMVREFQSVIGAEARAQILRDTGRLPDAVVACVGGGSNAMGIFDAFVADRGVRLIGVEAGGRGIRDGEHAARFAGGVAGVLHGTRSLLLQDKHGNILATHSVSAGLDYPSVGPEHAHLASIGRTEYAWVDDDAALRGFVWLARQEGLLPALESSHAAAWLQEHLVEFQRGAIVILNLSGRGDKDVETVRGLLEVQGPGFGGGR
ncbi:MAG: tryptophan synthase subunit beta [Acidimicrobiia bacterium]|nr:tryptophan synthase subunit beta [Acidimicrobiia bacterium]